MSEILINHNIADYANKGLYIKAEITLKGSYDGKYSTVYHVSDTSISSAKAEIHDQLFTGSEVTFDSAAADFAENFVVYTGKNKDTGSLEYGTEYEIIGYKNNINKGTATVTIRGCGKYSGTKTFSFKIVVKDVLK